MRKWTLILTAVAVGVIFLSPPVSAREVTGGVKFGFGVASAFGDDAEGAGTKGAFSAGAFFRWAPTRVWSFQEEFHYIQKGAGYDNDSNSVKTTLSYVEFQSLIKLSIPTKRVRPNLILGTYTAFNVGASMEGGGISMDISDYTQTVDSGLVLGTGLDIEVKKSLIMVEYHAEIGALQVPKDREGTGIDVHNIAHMFLLGYAF